MRADMFHGGAGYWRGQRRIEAGDQHLLESSSSDLCHGTFDCVNKKLPRSAAHGLSSVHSGIYAGADVAYNVHGWKCEGVGEEWRRVTISC